MIPCHSLNCGLSIPWIFFISSGVISCRLTVGRCQPRIYHITPYWFGPPSSYIACRLARIVPASLASLSLETHSPPFPVCSFYAYARDLCGNRRTATAQYFSHHHSQLTWEAQNHEPVVTICTIPSPFEMRVEPNLTFDEAKLLHVL